MGLKIKARRTTRGAEAALSSELRLVKNNLIKNASPRDIYEYRYTMSRTSLTVEELTEANGTQRKETLALGFRFETTTFGLILGVN